MPPKMSKVNQSVEKVLQIIEILTVEQEPMRLQDIGVRASMPPSTVMRMLNTLLVYGYVNQDPQTLRYSLSLKFAQIGSQVCSQVSMREVTHPLLMELSRRCQEASCLAMEDGMEMVFTDVVEGPDSMLKIVLKIGKRAPMHASAVGKVLLLNYNNRQLNELIAAKGLQALTPNTLVTKEALLLELDRTKRAGFAVENEERELGACSVAAPIYDYTGVVIAAISISGPRTRLSNEHIQAVGPVVRETADKISKFMAKPEH